MSSNGAITRTIPRSDLGLNGLIMASMVMVMVMAHRSFVEEIEKNKQKNFLLPALSFTHCYIIFALKIQYLKHL